METEREHIGKFLSVCTELVEGKYADANAKISDVLREISKSGELTRLFTAVTQEFDYARAKRIYLRYPVREGVLRGEMLLPTERSEILAFVFCLFVEIDAGTVKLSDLLLRYCYVDGSYTASYTVFAERVVRPFRDIVFDCFPAAKREADKHGERNAKLARISELFVREKARMEAFGLREEEQRAFGIIFAGICAALKGGDTQSLPALLAGYRYFLRYVGGENENSAAIFSLAAEL